MDIFSLEFEETLILHIKDKETVVKIRTFKTQDRGNVKFGVDAPRSLSVHREEIKQAIIEKERLTAVD